MRASILPQLPTSILDSPLARMASLECSNLTHTVFPAIRSEDFIALAQSLVSSILNCRCEAYVLGYGHMDTKAVEEGVDAYRAGIPRDAGPYDAGTPDHMDWLRGWEKAEEMEFEELA